MRYIKENLRFRHPTSNKELLVAALSRKLGKSENELKKLPKAELKQMWRKESTEQS